MLLGLRDSVRFSTRTRLRERWTSDALTVFADDKFLFLKVRSVEDMEKAMKETVVVLEVLKNMGVQVSHSKSEAVLLGRSESALT